MSVYEPVPSDEIQLGVILDVEMPTFYRVYFIISFLIVDV
jgi:hypothetical protein